MADYTYWENALKGEFGAIHDGDAMPGFYRQKVSKAAGYVPVAIWEQEGKIIALQNGEPANAADLWSYCADKPITHEHYTQRMETGKWWDQDDAVSASLAPPAAGHNRADEVDSIKDQIAAALNGVKEYTEIKDDTTAAKAQSLRSRLLDLRGEADKKREALVRPHLDAQTATNAVYMPLIKEAKAGADAIAKAIGAHETAKAREAARLAAIAADAARKAQEAAQARAPIGVTVEPEPVPSPPVAAPAPIKGAYGRAASVKTVRIGTVTDQDAAYAFLKAQPEVIEVIQKLAQKMVKNGITVPGVSITEEKAIV